MTYNHFYLAANIPQWGIFIGIALVIIAYIDKKEKLMTVGWIILIATGLISLWFNLTTNIGTGPESRVSTLITTGWQCATGAALAAASYLFQRIKNRYFPILGILTLLYFMLIFFQFNYISRSRPNIKQPIEQNDQNQKYNSDSVPGHMQKENQTEVI